LSPAWRRGNSWGCHWIFNGACGKIIKFGQREKEEMASAVNLPFKGYIRNILPESFDC